MQFVVLYHHGFYYYSIKLEVLWCLVFVQGFLGKGRGMIWSRLASPPRSDLVVPGYWTGC